MVTQDKRRPLSLWNNPITDILNVSAKAASGVADATANIGVNTLDAATGGLAGQSLDNISGKDSKAELAGLLGFMMNPNKLGKLAKIPKAVYKYYKNAPIARSINTAMLYEMLSPELEDMSKGMGYDLNLPQLTSMNQSDADIIRESEEQGLKLNKARLEIMKENDIMTDYEFYGRSNPLLDAVRPEREKMSTADSIYWAENW